MRNRLTLYRARITALRADRGSVTWHEAMATIREYHGDRLDALAHRLTAGFKQLRQHLADAFAPAAAAIGEFAEAMNDLHDELEAQPKFWEANDG